MNYRRQVDVFRSELWNPIGRTMRDPASKLTLHLLCPQRPATSLGPPSRLDVQLEATVSDVDQRIVVVVLQVNEKELGIDRKGRLDAVKAHHPRAGSARDQRFAHLGYELDEATLREHRSRGVERRLETGMVQKIHRDWRQYVLIATRIDVVANGL